MLPQILNYNSSLTAHHPVDREAIQQGKIYVAPPDHHLLVNRGYVQLTRGPKENRSRPAIDPLFRTAARYYGPRVVGVILSGSLDDGTAGLAAIKQRGGLAVVQDPREALFSGMPQSALDNVEVDHCLPIAEIAPLLARLVLEPAEAEDAYPVTERMDFESYVPQMKEISMEDIERIGEPSVFTCPECHGTLWEVHDGDLLRFRCHVGHAFSADSLMAEQSEALEGALWAALRALEENAAFSRRMAERARKHHQTLLAGRYEGNASELEQHALAIRQVLQTNEKVGSGD